MSKDYYQILGVDKSATDEQIKKAYRKLIKQNHPDTKKTEKEKEEAKQKTSEINEAYEILSNKEKREQYDIYGTVDNNFIHDFDDDEINEILREQMRRHGFGFNRERQQREEPLRGKNLRVNVRINLSEFLSDKDKEITFKRHIKCPVCNGTGSKDGKKTYCPYCKGTGYEVKTYRQGNAIYQEQTVCRHCGGTGEYIDPNNRCEKCFGTGFITADETIPIHIEKGNMNDIIVPYKGNDSLNEKGQPGNLIISFDIINDSKDICGNKYIIQNANGDLGLILPIGYATMILGGDIKLKDINNRTFTITVPKNTKPMNVLRVNGHGMTDRNALLIQLVMKDYTNIKEEERKVLEELKKIENKTN